MHSGHIKGRLSIEIDDELKAFRIWFELIENMEIVSEYKIPLQAIVNIFTESAVLKSKGYVDALENMDVYHFKESKLNEL